MRALRRLNYLLHQRRADADLAEEIEFHRAKSLEMGADPKAIGNTTRAREGARAVWIWPWLESVWQDGSYAVRNLRRQPGFTLVAVVTLGAAIGLNTSLFTVFNLFALRPWPVKDAVRVVRVYQNGRGFSVAEFRDLAAHSTMLAGLALKHDFQVHVGNGNGDATSCTVVSGNYFRLLGVEMELGRGLSPDEDRADAPQAVAVLSNAYWLEHFAADPQIIDKQIRVEGREFTVVGVVSRSFTLDRSFWLPLAALPLLQPHDVAQAGTPVFDPTTCCADVLGHLATDISATAAQAELNNLSRRFHEKSGQAAGTIEFRQALPYPDSKVHILPLFGLMYLAVMLVLMLTCANLANLLMARAEARRAEIYVRFSLGASRTRLVRQLLTESLLLAMIAAALGIGLAYRLPGTVLRQFHAEVPFQLTPDLAVLAYALALAVLSCLCFGLVPALQGTKPTGSRMRVRNILLAAEVAITVVLLVGASLLTKAVARSRSLDLGFSVADVTLVSFDFPAGSYDADGFHARLVQDLDDAAQLPVYGLAEREPLSSRSFNTGATTPFGWMEVQSVSPGYFDVLNISIVAGRALNSSDDERRAILVNETMARRYWNGQALGKQFKVGDSVREVVGVVKDSYSTQAGLERVDPLIYQPLPRRRTAALGKRPVPKILIRSQAGAVDMIAKITAAIDPRVRVQAEPLSESADRWLDPARTGAAIAGILGIFALALATVGMSGVFGYVVQQRTREIGIRMALGAQPFQVVRLVLAGSTRAVAIGLAVGLLAAAPLSLLMQQRLSGVNPLDLRAYSPAALALAVATLAASYLPARRATRIDPMSALRCE